MSEKVDLVATARERIHKTGRKLIAEGRIPGVVYGSQFPSTPVSVNRADFDRLAAHGELSRVLSLKIEGQTSPVNVLVSEVQHHYLKGYATHADFLAVQMDKLIEAVVPLHTVGEAAGVKIGGVLTINAHDVLVEALPANLPSAVEADITDLEIGDSLKLGDIIVPAGVSIKGDPEEVVISVTPPMKSIEEEEAEAAAEAGIAAEEVTEPEVIGEKDETEEA